MLQWKPISIRGADWSEIEAQQAELVQQVIATPETAYLLLSEPKPTFTRGRNAEWDDLLWSESVRNRENVNVATVDRGGKWTFHGPGQILIYPILFLPKLGFSSRDAKSFSILFAKTIQELLRVHFHVHAEFREEPFGLFVGGAKLASFGISIHHGVIHHGSAIYLKPQKHYFSGIHPCGVVNQPIVSIEELGTVTDWELTASLLTEGIKKVLIHKNGR